MNTYTNGLIVVVTLCGTPPLTPKTLSPRLWNSSGFATLLLNSGAARLINDTGCMVVKTSNAIAATSGRRRLIVVLIRANWLGHNYGTLSIPLGQSLLEPTQIHQSHSSSGISAFHTIALIFNYSKSGSQHNIMDIRTIERKDIQSSNTNEPPSIRYEQRSEKAGMAGHGLPSNKHDSFGDNKRAQPSG